MEASSSRRVGIALALAAPALFGLSHSVVVLAYSGGSNPLTVAATRFVLPILALLAFLAHQRKRMAIPGRNGVLAIGLGLLTAAYTLALLISLDFLPAGIAMLVFHLFPIFTGIIVATLGRAPIARKTLIAALIALGGLALTLGIRIDDYSVPGLALAVGAALGLGAVSAFSARVIAASDPLRATVHMSLGALACLVVVTAAMSGFQLPVTREGWMGFVLSHSFFAVGFVLYFVAIDRIGAATAATLGNLQPLVVIAVAFFLLGQSLTSLQLLGAVVVVGALITAARTGP